MSVGFIWVLSVISLLSCTKFSGDWGIIWGTLARTNARNQYGVPFTVFAYIVGVFSPTEATAVSFLLEHHKKDDRDIGFVIETPGFLPRESGFRNLRYLASIRNVVGKERIRECITMVGLDPDDQKWVGKYSLGMRQRLGIAQAIMENPDLIILDEPMNGLDNHGVEEIRKLLGDTKAPAWTEGGGKAHPHHQS